MKYNPHKIETKWQERWYNSSVFSAKGGSASGGKAISKKKKYYPLIEFPYPSGDGLHVGHVRSYTAFDIIARKRRMQGFNVLYPIGWDAFGLPTENYAIKKGLHPSVVTEKNTDNFRSQMKNLGLSFDWSREVNTTDPKYYKWTQWIFVQLFKNGLAYKAKMDINWCPSCKIGLANEEVVEGKCERCGTKVEKREKEQWMIRITNYADRLIRDLESVDYLEKIKIQQKDWIGESHGALIKFPVEGIEEPIEVFTTRIDTIFSGTFLILAPGHNFIDKYKGKIKNIDEVLKYREDSKNVSDIDRTNLDKEITGVQLMGITVRNPATNEEMPVWTADFVLEQYGTGAVFADAHDKRDFKMAKKYGIPLRTSIKPPASADSAFVATSAKGAATAGEDDFAKKIKNLEECYEGEGTLYNSMEFDGQKSVEARPKIIVWLSSKGLAQPKTSYKLRDWVFSRQHYWGEPIPMIFCKRCGWQSVDEKDLPVKLPNVKKYKPTDTGESPLSLIKKWVDAKCPKCQGRAERETDTMPNWAGSNWYYLAYLMRGISNFQFPISKYEQTFKYWMPVDWYNGGMEHTTLHLLYSRFIFKFLWDIKAVPTSIGPEPYKKRTSHGMVLGEGGIKMSKSKGNVINPDTIVKQYGADTLRLYEMFMGPFEQMIPWDTKGVVGCRRFIEKIWKLFQKLQITNSKSQTNPKSQIQNDELRKLLHKTIKKVSEDVELMKFNTAVSSMMEFVNACFARRNGVPFGSEGGAVLDGKDLADFLKILSPFAPHLAEELWADLGNKPASAKGFGAAKELCCEQKWPKYDEKLIEDKNIVLIVQINGKVRDKIETKAGISQKEAEKLALKSEKIKALVGKSEVKKIVFVPNKLINIVT